MANLSKLCYSGHRLYPGDNGQIYECDGCKTSGKGLRYWCKACEYNLHIECMHSKEPISLEIFEGVSYEFEFFAPRKAKKYRADSAECRNSCFACGMPIEKFVYHCKDVAIDLHPVCALVPNKFPVLQNDDFDITNKAGGGNSGGDTGGGNLGGDTGGDGGGDTGGHTRAAKIKGIPNLVLEIKEEQQKIQPKNCSNKKRGPPRRRTELCLKLFETVLAATISALVGDPTAMLGLAVVYSMFN